MVCTLTSKGLENSFGRKIIKKALKKAGYNKDSLRNKSILLCTLPKYGIEEVLTKAVIEELGFARENVYICSKEMERRVYDFVYVSEGNIYVLASFLLNECDAENIIKESIKKGGYYIGASAGAMLASTTIRFARDFDKSLAGAITDLHGLGLLDKTYGATVFIPHYNRAEFERWKRLTPEIMEFEYGLVTNIPENGFRNF